MFPLVIFLGAMVIYFGFVSVLDYRTKGIDNQQFLRLSKSWYLLTAMWLSGAAMLLLGAMSGNVELLVIGAFVVASAVAYRWYGRYRH